MRNADEYGNTHTPITFHLGPPHMDTHTSNFMNMMNRHRRDIEVKELSRIKAELAADGYVRKPRVVLNKAQNAAGSLQAAVQRQEEKLALNAFVLEGELKHINMGQSLDKLQKDIKKRSVSPPDGTDLHPHYNGATKPPDTSDFQAQTQSVNSPGKKTTKTIIDRLAVGAADAATAKLMSTPGSLPSYRGDQSQ